MNHRILILFSLFLLCLSGIAGATDYYVSTTGSNASDGLTVETAWRNVSYAVAQLDTPGDTLYLIDGIYYNEDIVFEASGNDTSNITVMRFNGTPTIQGDWNGYGVDFGYNTNIVIDGIKLNGHLQEMYRFSNYTYIQNCNIGNSSDATIYISGDWNGGNLHDITFLNNTIFNTDNESFSGGPNMIDIIGSDPNDGQLKTYNISFIDNDIYGHGEHQILNIQSRNPPYFPYVGLSNMTITGNSFHDFTRVGTGRVSGIYSIVAWGTMENVTIENNQFYNFSNNAIIGAFNNSIIKNNIATNLTYNSNNQHFAAIAYYTNNTNVNNFFENNTYDISDAGIIINYGYDNELLNEKISYFYAYLSSEFSILDPIKKTNKITVRTQSKITLNYSDNSIISIIKNTGNDSVLSDFKYTDTQTQIEFNAIDDESATTHTFTTTKYNITFTPDSGYGHTISVNTEKVNDISNITANVSEPTTATLTFLVDNITNTYNLSVDGVYNQDAISDSDSIISFDYEFESATETDFEISWASSTGWNPSQNVIYKNKICTFYNNNTFLCSTATQDETIINTFMVVIS